MKRKLCRDIAERMKSIIKDKEEMLSMDNYHDSDGVPQAHLDGLPQSDDYYDYYINRGIVPPHFEEYRLRRYEAASEEDRMTCMYNVDITEDEQTSRTSKGIHC